MQVAVLNTQTGAWGYPRENTNEFDSGNRISAQTFSLTAITSTQLSTAILCRPDLARLVLIKGNRAMAMTQQAGGEEEESHPLLVRAVSRMHHSPPLSQYLA